MTDNAKEEYVDYVPGTEDQHTVPDIDPQAVKKLLWKLDMRLVPMLGLLFLLAFIDRINIGNARIQGLEKDLNMTGTDYSIALFMFFIPYILLEVPSNMLLKNVRPSIYLPSSMIGWGIVTICQGVTASFGGLVACRVLIGVFEAGFYPGCVYLLSMFYRRYELQKRLNIFFSFSVIAGAFSGLFAYGVAHMDGIGGYAGWRWIFIIEGIMTVVAAAFGYLVIPDWPETSKFLHADERRLLIRILAADRANTSMNRIDRATVLRVFKDIKLYLGYVVAVIQVFSPQPSNSGKGLDVSWNSHHELQRSIFPPHGLEATELDFDSCTGHEHSNLRLCHILLDFLGIFERLFEAPLRLRHLRLSHGDGWADNLVKHDPCGCRGQILRALSPARRIVHLSTCLDDLAEQQPQRSLQAWHRNGRADQYWKHWGYHCFVSVLKHVIFHGRSVELTDLKEYLHR